MGKISPATLRRTPVNIWLALAAVAYIFVALAPLPVHADFGGGLKAYDAGDYATAAKEWRRAADAGDLAAQRNLGHLYRWGKGVKQDLALAAKWYRRAAIAGFDRAQLNLALLHLNGQGVKRDEAEAARWLSKAADAGNPEAQYRLAQLLETGKGVAIDRAKAYAFYGLAARAGHKAAAIRLAGQPGGTATLKQLKGDGAVRKPVSYVAKAKATIARDKRSVLGEYLASRVINRLSPKPNEVPLSKGAVAAHLASYRLRDRARAGWDLLSVDEEGVRDLKPRVRQVDIPGRGRFYRLYAVGDAARLRRLCKSLVLRGKYCVLTRQSLGKKDAAGTAP